MTCLGTKTVEREIPESIGQSQLQPKWIYAQEGLPDVTHLSAALNMPLAVCALRSGGHEERKISSSFIMERTFEADTSARDRSNARLEGHMRT